MDEEVLSVLSTGQVTIPYQGGEFGELVSIYNLPGNTNRVFFRINGDATTSEAAVSPDNYSPPILLDPKRNASGVNIIAETGTTAVRVFRTPFRSRLERLIAQVGLWAGLTASFWRAISGTQIALKGAFVEARMDVVRAKTTGTNFVAQNDQGNNGLVLAAGANGDASLQADGTGQAAIASGPGTTFVVAKGSGSLEINFTVNNTQRAQIDGTNGLTLLNSSPASLAAGSGDTRHTLSMTDRVLHTPSAGGLLNSVTDAIELPILSGNVIAVGDIVELLLTNNRVRTAQAASTVGLGVAIVGGTGNAGGTVFARVRFTGVVVQTLAGDTAGVTQGRYGHPGAANPTTRIEDATTIEGSFCRVLTTAGSGALTDVFLHGPL